MTVKLTERDRQLVAKCAICRWLTTTQLKRLYFPTASLSAVQKRLRKLADAGYMRSHREHPTSEIIHAVGPKGKPLAEEAGCKVVMAAEVPKQIEHLVGINEVRIAAETCGIEVRYFFAHWQLADLGWTEPVIPDAVFAFRHGENKMLALEYDRGTETLEVLLRKLAFYENGIQGCPLGAIVIATETDRRIDVLARAMKERALSQRVLSIPLMEISTDFAAARFFNLATGKHEPLFIAESLP
jgi:hypothetical protein